MGNYFEFGPVVQEEMHIFLIHSSDWPSCLAEQNQLGNFGREHYEGQICAIISILLLDQWFRRRCSLKIMLI